jgi:hypothetical protein
MSFIGQPRTEWLNDARSMILMEDFAYMDKRDKMWVAKAGMIFDGASIPRVMWRLIGSPFTGNYRNPAIIHDAMYDAHRRPDMRPELIFSMPDDLIELHLRYVADRSRYDGKETRAEVDKIFYEGMIENGVSWIKAQIMHKAVRYFGPNFP